MSLSFGVYLVEQRIVSPEQFCGLVKIQQESTRSLASLSIKHNILTIKQVSRLQDIAKVRRISFLDIGIEEKLLDRDDCNRLARLQEQTGASIRVLAVDCGLLTQRQCEVLYNHFLRHGSRPVSMSKRPATARPAPKQKQKTGATPKRTVPAPKPKFRKSPLISTPENARR